MPSKVPYSCTSLYVFIGFCWASALWYLSVPGPSTSSARHERSIPVRKASIPVHKAAKLPESVIFSVIHTWQPLHPHRFAFLINESKKCEAAETPFLVILVSTALDEFAARQAIRETWGDESAFAFSIRIITLFLLGRSMDPALDRMAEQESQVFHDVVRMDFIDSYYNLTLKTLMGMRWVATFCPEASYVLKADSDIFVNMENLVFNLLKPTAKPRQRYFTGHVINGGPIRDMHSKWFMPIDLYPQRKYPPFCSGTGYVFSADIAGLVYEASLHTRLLHLEDVYVGLCLRSLAIRPFQNRDFNPRNVAYNLCRYRSAITVHQISPEEMHFIWNDMNSKKHLEC